METEIDKSSLDKRQYRLITLSNKLQCLLVSDETSKKSAASMMVKVGMLDDPIDAQGLAHFLEHMLFMGSQKYPGVNDFNSYVQKNSGETNASTSIDGTQYYFEIANQGFWEALDKWGQFFVAPLLSEGCIEREMNAVESEFQLSLSEDESRVWEIFRKISNENSTFNKFGCGNLKTLNQPKIREKLFNFYEKFYCASLMKLTIYSANSLDDIESRVKEIFSFIPFKQAIQPEHHDNPFSDKGPTYTKILSVKDEDVIYLTWIIPNQTKNYETKADQYISHILGFEGRNSLTSYLEDEGLIQSLSSGISYINDSYEQLELQIFLTELGFKQWESVVGYVFKYINILKSQGIQKYIYDELAEIGRLSFQNKENNSCISQYTSKLSKYLHFYPLCHLLSHEYIYSNFNESLINSLLDELTLQNAIIIVRSLEFQSESKDWMQEELYGTKFVKLPLPNSLTEICKEDTVLAPKQTLKKLGIPLNNEYIPSQFEIKGIEQHNTKYPSLIHQDPYHDVWFLKDNQFNVCKGSIQLNIYPNQLFVTNPEARVMLELWMYVFSHYTREKEYEAQIAKLSYESGISYNSIEIKVSGFHHHLSKYFQDMMSMLVNFHQNPEREILKYVYDLKMEELEQRYENYYFKSPYDLTFSYWKQVMFSRGKYSKVQLEKAFKKITYEKFLDFNKNLFKKIKIQWLISGNVTKQEALDITDQTIKLIQQIGSPHDNIIDLPLIKIKQGPVQVYERMIDDNPEEKNSGIMVYFQALHSNELEDELMMCLVSNLLSDPVENQLRTTEQLGYVVQCYKIMRRGVIGLIFGIISQDHGPNYLATRINDFLTQFRQTIDPITQEEFDNMKSALNEDQTQEYQNLHEQSSDFFKEIVHNTKQFDRKQIVEKTLEKITLDKFKQGLMDVLYVNPRRIEIHVLNPLHKKQDEQFKKLRTQTGEISFQKNFDQYEKFDDLHKYL